MWNHWHHHVNKISIFFFLHFSFFEGGELQPVSLPLDVRLKYSDFCKHEEQSTYLAHLSPCYRGFLDNSFLGQNTFCTHSEYLCTRWRIKHRLIKNKVLIQSTLHTRSKFHCNRTRIKSTLYGHKSTYSPTSWFLFYRCLENSYPSHCAHSLKCSKSDCDPSTCKETLHEDQGTYLRVPQFLLEGFSWNITCGQNVHSLQMS